MRAWSSAGGVSGRYAGAKPRTGRRPCARWSVVGARGRHLHVPMLYPCLQRGGFGDAAGRRSAPRVPCACELPWRPCGRISDLENHTHLYNEYTGGRAGGCVYRQCGADIQDRSAERQKSQVTNTHLHTRRPAPGHMSGPGPRTADRTPVGPGRIHVRFEMIQGNVAHVRCGIHMWYKSCSLSFLVFFCVTAVYIYFPVSPG